MEATGSFIKSEMKRTAHDSRLIRIGLHDATLGSILQPTGAGFTVNLGNVLSQIQSLAMGYSVESVGFYNLMRNVQLGISDQIEVSIGFLDTVLVVAPGQYTLAELLVALQAQLDLVFLGDAVVSVNADGRIVFTYTGAQLPPWIIFGEGTGDSNQLASTLGFSQEITTLSPTVVVTAENHYDLGGERVGFLHCQSLQHSKHSVDGDGRSLSFSASFPINAPYGAFNLVYPNQYETPCVSWDETHEIREIILRLRNIRGQLMNLQGTKWFVTLRVFIMPIRSVA